jgi:hypothetical protein
MVDALRQAEAVGIVFERLNPDDPEENTELAVKLRAFLAGDYAHAE